MTDYYTGSWQDALIHEYSTGMGDLCRIFKQATAALPPDELARMTDEFASAVLTVSRHFATAIRGMP